MTQNNQPEENPEFSSEDMAVLLEKSTLPADIGIHLEGRYGSEDEAREVWQTTLIFMKLFGTSLNLEGVEAVTIADDYAGALTQVQRGFETTHTLTPSNDEFGSGAAMAVPVIRDGRLKTHTVLYSGISRALLQPDCDVYQNAVHTLAHEAAHAHDHLTEAKAFPGL